MAEVTNNGELSKSAKRRAAKKARDEKYVEEAAPPPAPEPVPEKKPKAKAAATPEPKAKAKEAPKAAAKPKAKAKEEPAKPEPKAAAAKGKAAAKAAAAPEAAKPKGAAKADPKAKAGAKAPAPAPAPEPKAQAKGKAKAKAEPAPPAPAAAKAALQEPEKERADLVQPFEMVMASRGSEETTEDDGTGGDWEQSTGLSKKAEKRKEKEEQRKREQAIEAAQAKKTVPGMAPTNTVPGMAPPKAASKEEIAAFMAGVKEKGAAARAQVEAENACPPECPRAEKTSMHTAQIKVPENKTLGWRDGIGIVIGPKGSKIKLIQEKTGVTRIDTSGEMFTIVGPQQAVEMAYAAVKELMEKGYCSMAFEDFKEEAVPVHPSVFPDLIGKGGVTIKAFKSELNVEITIPGDIPKTATTGTKKYKVTLAGKKDDVNKAKQVIENIVSYGYHEITHPGQTHEEIEVEPWAYKFLIGKAGSELRHIQNNYKVKVNIPREHSVCQNVVVVGVPGDVARAKDYIDNVLWKAQNQPTGRRDGDAAIDTWGQEDEEEDWMKAYIYKRK
ncbi:FUBP1 [Symbiodinium sp. CCMP2592]|nr:FUBP1 [Symbiodinium sp. CCMP2592]